MDKGYLGVLVGMWKGYKCEVEFEGTTENAMECTILKYIEQASNGWVLIKNTTQNLTQSSTSSPLVADSKFLLVDNLSCCWILAHLPLVHPLGKKIAPFPKPTDRNRNRLAVYLLGCCGLPG